MPSRPTPIRIQPTVLTSTAPDVAFTANARIAPTAIAVVSAVVLAKNDAAGATPLRVDVFGQQFFWSYSYPGYDDKESSILRLPVDRSVDGQAKDARLLVE